MARNRSTHNAPVSPAGAGGINRARQIATQGQSPMQQAQAMGGRTVASSPTTPVATGNNWYAGVPNQIPAASNWGMAGAQNVATRANAGRGNEPPIIWVNVFDPTFPAKTVPIPNPKFLATLPARPPKPNPESPVLPVSPITKIVDEIIRESEEVVDEIITKQEPVREPVDTKQDIVLTPVPVTPTELVLQAQSSCEQNIMTPTINIEIINENNITMQATTNFSASLTAIATVEAFRLGCMDPDALNYDPAANLDNGLCKFEPIKEDEPVVPTPEPPPEPLDIPDLVQYVDSHGQVVFEVPRELVEMTEIKIDEETNLPDPEKPDGVITLTNGETIIADLQLVKELVRPTLEDSDLIFSPEDSVVADKKDTRDLIGGELASDTQLDSEKDIVIMDLSPNKNKKQKEKIVAPLIRNDNGLIIMTEGDRPKLSISLRSQSFTKNQYARSIDTKFTELVGRL